jgi:hypothetical protein
LGIDFFSGIGFVWNLFVYFSASLRFWFWFWKRKRKLSVSIFSRAAIFQHEIDHLDGVVYLDRMTGLKDLCFTEEMMEFRLEADAIEEGTIKFFDR